jgi:hypothetical protein
MSVSRTCPVCGYAGRYASAAQAEACHRRHSCQRQAWRAQVARRWAHRAAGDLTRGCPHHGRPHVHGTRSAYVKDRCRCPACAAANAQASQDAVRRHVTRTDPSAEAAPVAAHIRELRQAGIGWTQIGRLTGTSRSHIREIAGATARSAGRPPLRKVRRDTARRILAVPAHPASRSRHSQLDATGTRRRLQALVAIGWPVSRLAQQLGHRPGSLRRRLTADTVTVGTAQHIRELYARLWDTAPAAASKLQQTRVDQARRRARVHGWLPPLAWDDIDTDPAPVPPRHDPADVDEIAVDRAVNGAGIRLAELTAAEQAEAIRRLTDRGKSLREIADQLATTKRTICRHRAAARDARAA